MIGVESTSDEKGYKVAGGLFERGVLVAGTLVNAKTLRFEPPLNIFEEQVNAVLNAVELCQKGYPVKPGVTRGG